MPDSNLQYPVDVLHEPIVASLDDVLFIFVATIESDFLRCNTRISSGFSLEVLVEKSEGIVRTILDQPGMSVPQLTLKRRLMRVSVSPAAP